LDIMNLRRLARDVDARHRDAMRTLPDDLAALHFDCDDAVRSSRRQFLRAGAVITIAGTSVALGPLVGSASAADTTTTTTTTIAVHPTDDDLTLLAFAQSVELVAVAAYQSAIDSKKLTDATVAEVAMIFQGHHREHAAAFAALAGKAAQDRPNQKLLDAFAPKFKAAADQTALLELAYDLENAAASTYLYALGVVQATEPAKLVGSILPIEADHAVVLGQVLKKGVNDYVPEFETASSALKPADYPLA
jgi:rubrerythrin